jgi:hypothetical protein
MKKIIGFTLLASAVISGCVSHNIEKSNTIADLTASYNSINKKQLIEHIKVLS